MTSESGPRSRYHHGDLREALLEAAEGLLEESGVSGLTLRACARRAGVSHAAPKHHFTDVSELLAQVAARSFDRLTETLDAERHERADQAPTARITGIFRAYVSYARRWPDHFRLMFRWDQLGPENPLLREAAARTYAAMTSSVTAQRGDEEVTAQTLDERIRERGLQDDVIVAWSQIHGFAMLLLEGQFDGFAMEEGMDAFVARNVDEIGTRLSRLLRERRPP